MIKPLSFHVRNQTSIVATALSHRFVVSYSPTTCSYTYSYQPPGSRNKIFHRCKDQQTGILRCQDIWNNLLLPYLEEQE